MTEGLLRIVVFLVFGVVIGAIAGMVLPGRARREWLASILVGAAGSMVGGLLASALGLAEGSRSAFLTSALGAVGWLAIYRLVKRRAERMTSAKGDAE